MQLTFFVGQSVVENINYTLNLVISLSCLRDTTTLNAYNKYKVAQNDMYFGTKVTALHHPPDLYNYINS